MKRILLAALGLALSGSGCVIPEYSCAYIRNDGPIEYRTVWSVNRDDAEQVHHNWCADQAMNNPGDIYICGVCFDG